MLSKQAICYFWIVPIIPCFPLLPFISLLRPFFNVPQASNDYFWLEYDHEATLRADFKFERSTVGIAVQLYNDFAFNTVYVWLVWLIGLIHLEAVAHTPN